MWLVENHIQNLAIRDEINQPLRVYRELEDLAGRIAHMDQMGFKVQVIFLHFSFDIPPKMLRQKGRLPEHIIGGLLKNVPIRMADFAGQQCFHLCVPRLPRRNSVGLRIMVPVVFLSVVLI